MPKTGFVTFANEVGTLRLTAFRSKVTRLGLDLDKRMTTPKAPQSLAIGARKRDTLRRNVVGKSREEFPTGCTNPIREGWLTWTKSLRKPWLTK